MQMGNLYLFYFMFRFCSGATSATATVNITVSNPRPTCVSMSGVVILWIWSLERKNIAFSGVHKLYRSSAYCINSTECGGELQSNGYQVAVSLTNSGKEQNHFSG